MQIEGLCILTVIASSDSERWTLLSHLLKLPGEIVILSPEFRSNFVS